MRRDPEMRFRSRLAASPGRIRLRLAAARRMAREADLPAAGIALRCGYSTPSALTRAVRARFGTKSRAMPAG